MSTHTTARRTARVALLEAAADNGWRLTSMAAGAMSRLERDEAVIIVRWTDAGVVREAERTDSGPTRGVLEYRDAAKRETVLSWLEAVQAAATPALTPLQARHADLLTYTGVFRDAAVAMAARFTDADESARAVDALGERCAPFSAVDRVRDDHSSVDLERATVSAREAAECHDWSGSLHSESARWLRMVADDAIDFFGEMDDSQRESWTVGNEYGEAIAERSRETGSEHREYVRWSLWLELTLWTKVYDASADGDAVADAPGTVLGYVAETIGRNVVGALVQAWSEDRDAASERAEELAQHRYDTESADDLHALRVVHGPGAPAEYGVAVALEDGGVHDYLGSWETAQQYATDGYRVVALTGDAHLTRDDLQELCNRERALAADCFGVEYLTF